MAMAATLAARAPMPVPPSINQAPRQAASRTISGRRVP
jgi:hypothetical protein